MSPIKIVYYVFLILAFFLSLHDRNSKDPTLRILPWLLGLGIFTQVLEDILEREGFMHTIVFHLYNLLEFPLYALYFSALFHARSVRRTLLFCVIAYIAFFIYYFTCVRSIEMEAFGAHNGVEGLMMCAFSLYFFYQLLVSENYYNLRTYPHFYINTGNLIFFSLTLLAMSFNVFLNKANPQEAKRMLEINNYSNVLMYILYCIGFFCNIWIPTRSSSS